jgi:hypothetical protein
VRPDGVGRTPLEHAAPERHVGGPDIAGDTSQACVIGGKPRRQRRDSAPAPVGGQPDQSVARQGIGPVSRPQQPIATVGKQSGDNLAEF